MKSQPSDSEEALLRRLAAANPYKRERFLDYGGSPEARRAWARVLAAPGEMVAGRDRPRKRRLPRPAWIGAAVLVVVAVALTVVYLEVETTQPPAAVRYGSSSPATPALPSTASTKHAALTPSPTVAGLPSPSPGSVLGPEALAAIVELAGEVTTSPKAYPPTPGLTDLNMLIGEALGLGILRASEGPDFGLRVPVGSRDYLIPVAVSRQTYALWLWRAFGPLLAPTTPSVRVTDLGSFAAEERVAVTGLARAGIIEAYPDGTFRGSLLLTQAQEETLLQRVRQALPTAR